MIDLCDYRYPWDQYDRIWDADMDFSPFHISTGFKVYSTFNLSSLKETPPAAVLQTARVPRKKVLTYNLPLDTLGNYYVVLYFAGILPISPLFDVLINGDVVQSNYTVKRLEVSALFITRKRIKSLDITLKSISRYPQINAIEVYEIVDIPSESSSTTGAISIFLCHALLVHQSIFIPDSWYSFSFSPSGYSAIHWIRSGMGR